MALDKGLQILKFFPAEALGGVKMLKAIAAPYGGVKFIPTGGINQDNLAEYLAQPSVHCCGGSWLVKAKQKILRTSVPGVEELVFWYRRDGILSTRRSIRFSGDACSCAVQGYIRSLPLVSAKVNSKRDHLSRRHLCLSPLTSASEAYTE